MNGVTTIETSAQRAAAGGALGALRELYRYVSPRRRRQGVGLIAFTLVGAAAEVVTIGSVLPLMALIADPRATDRFPALGRILGIFGITRGESMLLPVAVLFGIVAIITAAIRLSLTWSSQKYVFKLGHDISALAYAEVLQKPYSYHVRQNSSVIIAATQKAQLVVSNMLMPLMQGFTAFIITVFVLGGLFLLSPGIAAISSITFGAVYIGVSAITRVRLRRSAKVVAQSLSERVQTVQEGLGAIRDIILDHAQDVYFAKFSKIDARMRDAQASLAFYAAAPRFIVESTGMVLIAGLAIYLSRQPGGFATALPILGALAVGAQRLLPLLQQIYLGWSQMMAQRQNLLDVIDMFPATPGRAKLKPPIPLTFRESIHLSHVDFRYGSDGPLVLRGIDLLINKGARIGFIGKTGSGKSTIMDLLMGLLPPTSGDILVDGVALDEERRRSWQAQVAHVPQSIYLSDSSIIDNIAFGVAAGDIDWGRARDAAVKADIAAFIDSLPEGYDTFVGERGVRLSGGQRQRIGIARALYKNASVLVFDEATSALDDATEAAVMASIDALGSELTVLIVAHRLSTVRNCDHVYRFTAGNIEETTLPALEMEAAPTLSSK